CLAVQETIVDYLHGESARSVFVRAAGDANNLTCTKNLGVLLAGDFDRHLEEHLQQLALGWSALRVDEQPGLAEVVDGACDQLNSALVAELHRQGHVQTPRSRRPCSLADDVLVGNRRVAVSYSLPQPLHGWPVVLILVAADEAYLVIVAFRALARPSKFVSADSRK